MWGGGAVTCKKDKNPSSYQWPSLQGLIGDEVQMKTSKIQQRRYLHEYPHPHPPTPLPPPPNHQHRKTRRYNNRLLYVFTKKEDFLNRIASPWLQQQDYVPSIHRSRASFQQLRYQHAISSRSCHVSVMVQR